MEGTKKKYTRKFLGKIDGFENKQERDFENKHLRAYLKGNDRFIVGYKRNNLDILVPVYDNVKQELTEL